MDAPPRGRERDAPEDVPSSKRTRVCPDDVASFTKGYLVAKVRRIAPNDGGLKFLEGALLFFPSFEAWQVTSSN